MAAESRRERPEGMTGLLAGRPVNRIGYGAMRLPVSNDTERAATLLRRAVELGVDHIDTAQFYGGGRVNEAIRAALHPYPDSLRLVSKVGVAFDPAAQFGLVPAQRPEQLRAGVEANLRSLGVERLDVVNLRRLDGGGPGVPATADQLVDLDSQLAELVAMRQEGKIGGIGLSNVTLDQLRQALPTGIVCVQNQYSLLDRSGEPLLDECRSHDVAWVPFFPLVSTSSALGSVADHPTVIAAAETVGALPAQVALAWLLAHDPHVLLIPGTGSLDHLAQNLAVANVTLPADVMARLDDLTA